MKSIQIVWGRTFFKAACATLLMPSLLLLGLDAAEEVDAPVSEKQEEAKPDRKSLELPGLRIRLEERYVDVDATVCLRVGMLELIACTKDTKEHEAILSVHAKAAHIHAALLLIGAKPGNPAMRKPINEEQTRWVDLPPRGQEIDVFIVIEDEEGKLKEHPMSEFLVRSAEDVNGGPVTEEQKKDRRFPTHTFLFAGSHLWKHEDRPPRYLADDSGNVLSLATFGDELLCLPGVHAHENGGLVWEVDATHLPALDSKVILRLRPRFPEQAPKGEGAAKENKPKP